MPSCYRYGYADRDDCPAGISGAQDSVEFEVELLSFDKEGHWQVCEATVMAWRRGGREGGRGTAGRCVHCREASIFLSVLGVTRVRTAAPFSVLLLLLLVMRVMLLLMMMMRKRRRRRIFV